MAWNAQLKARWAALAARERAGLLLASLAVALYLVWSALVAPALRTLRTADAQAATLRAELDRMQALQARARLLQARSPVAPQEALAQLQAAVQALGKQASLQVSGQQATVVLQQVSAAALASLLTPTAVGASGPSEARLQRDANAAKPSWSGTLLFQLPAAGTKAP